MDIMKHSSTQGAHHHAMFRRKEPCCCGHRFFSVTDAKVIEVDFVNGLEKAFFTSVRLGVKLGHVASRTAISAADVTKAAFECNILLEFNTGTIAIPSQYTKIFAQLLEDLEAGPYEINAITHDAVQVSFNCSQCHKNFVVTYEISMDGKEEIFGCYRYSKIRKEKRIFCPENWQKISFRYVREKYYGMESYYSLRKMNCKIWSRQFFHSVFSKFEDEQRARAAELEAEAEKQRARVEEQRAKKVTEEKRIEALTGQAIKKNSRIREARRRMEEAMKWDVEEAMGIRKSDCYNPELPLFGRICSQILYDTVIDPWNESMRREIERRGRIEMRNEKLKPRRRYPEHPIPMPSRLYYYCAMNSDHLYRCHETLYGYVEEDFSFWVV